MSEWTEHELGEFASIQTGPFGSQLHASDYVPIGVPSIMPKNIGGRLDVVTSDIARIRESDAQRLVKYRVQPTDIVYSRRGDVEKCAFVTDEQDGWLCGTGCIRVRFKSDRVDPKFVALSLSTPDVRGWISSNAVGTIMPNLNTGILQKVPLLLPTLKEQQAIAEVLTSLDDKIDLLHRQNKTLEALAETLFRQWFIEEADDQWEEGAINEVVEILGGTTPSTKEPQYWNGDIYWTTPRDLSNQASVFLFDTARKITEEGLAKIGSGLLPRGTLLMSSRAPIGYLAITDIPIAINQGYIAILNNKDFSNHFMYLWCRLNLERIKNSGNGSVFQEISKSSFKQLRFVIPSKRKREQFDSIVGSHFSKIRKNQKQIRTLEKLRDTLLPKLMSGEVRVDYE